MRGAWCAGSNLCCHTMRTLRMSCMRSPIALPPSNRKFCSVYSPSILRLAVAIIAHVCHERAQLLAHKAVRDDFRSRPEVSSQIPATSHAPTSLNMASQHVQMSDYLLDWATSVAMGMPMPGVEFIAQRVQMLIMILHSEDDRADAVHATQIIFGSKQPAVLAVLGAAVPGLLDGLVACCAAEDFSTSQLAPEAVAVLAEHDHPAIRTAYESELPGILERLCPVVQGAGAAPRSAWQLGSSILLLGIIAQSLGGEAGAQLASELPATVDALLACSRSDEHWSKANAAQALGHIVSCPSAEVGTALLPKLHDIMTSLITCLKDRESNVNMGALRAIEAASMCKLDSVNSALAVEWPAVLSEFSARFASYGLMMQAECACALSKLARSPQAAVTQALAEESTSLLARLDVSIDDTHDDDPYMCDIREDLVRARDAVAALVDAADASPEPDTAGVQS